MIDREKIVERRRALRHKLKVPLRLRNWGSTSADRTGESINISASGAYLETDLPLKVGSLVDLRLRLPHEITGQPTTEWRCKGRIVRITAHPASSGLARVGVRFDWLDGSRG